MKRIFSFCLFLTFFATPVFSQGHTGLNKFLDIVFRSVSNKNSPGCAVTVIQNGKVIAKKAYGMANIELQVPFSHQSVVRIGYSEAREFISIAAVLMETGLIK